MEIITSREFRANQKKYLELAESETVYIARRNKKPIAISVADDDNMPSKEDLEAINRSLEEIRSGKTYEMKPKESLDDFVDRVKENV